jgi:hypothetical protein
VQLDLPRVLDAVLGADRDVGRIVGNPQNSWVTSEPAIYYQAAYIELVSRFQP